MAAPPPTSTTAAAAAAPAAGGPGAPLAVVLVRHGATEWSAAGRHTGRTDVPLSAEGRTEAARLKGVLMSVIPPGPVHVFTSPLARAADTCAIVMPGAQPVVSDALVEWDYGSIEGRTTEEVRRANPAWDLFEDGTPDGESLSQVVARCHSFVAKVERVAAGGTVVAFTHGHVSRVLTTQLLGWPASAAASIYNGTASVAVVEWRRGVPVLSGWNLRAR